MQKRLIIFLIRWLANSFGLWVAVRLLGTGSVNIHILGFLMAGFIFSVINTFVKPVLVILSLPAIMLTLGLFMIIVNGLLVYISVSLTPGISMTFLNAIITGMILSLVNYIVSATLVLSDNEV